MYKFEKLRVWQVALDYMDLMYELAGDLPPKEKFNLASQVCRASSSICLNIAEGSMGQTNKEQSKFLGYAIRSTVETVAVQKMAERRNYDLDKQRLLVYYQKSEELTKMLQAFRNKIDPNKNWAREDTETYGNSDLSDSPDD